MGSHPSSPSSWLGIWATAGLEGGGSQPGNTWMALPGGLSRSRLAALAGAQELGAEKEAQSPRSERLRARVWVGWIGVSGSWVCGCPGWAPMGVDARGGCRRSPETGVVCVCWGRVRGVSRRVRRAREPMSAGTAKQRAPPEVARGWCCAAQGRWPGCRGSRGRLAAPCAGHSNAWRHFRLRPPSPAFLPWLSLGPASPALPRGRTAGVARPFPGDALLRPRGRLWGRTRGRAASSGGRAACASVL